MRKWNEIAVTTMAASVATSRALLGACAISALRPAVSATAATRASIAARQMERGDPGRGASRAWVSTRPTSAQARVRPNATELTGAMPPGTAILQPTTTPATVNPKRTTCSSLDETKNRRPGRRRRDGSPTSQLDLHLVAHASWDTAC